MIERDFIAQKTKEFYIKQFMTKKLKGVGISEIRLKKIPLGEKIIISANKPSLIVGSKGSNIRLLTKELKKNFKLENPQIEITEVKDIFLDANIVAQRIAGSLERFGSARFKGVGHKTMENILRAGALGVEIIISGKIPGSRAKSWRFYQGYLKKCGDVAITGVRHAQTTALLKSGIIGIKVSIMPPDLVLPDSIKLLDEPVQIVEESDAKSEEKPAKKATKKKAAKKSKKKEAKEEVVTEEKKETPEEKSEDAPVAEEAKTEESQSEKPAEEVPAEEPKTEEAPVEESQSEKPVEEEPKTEEVAEEKPVEESVPTEEKTKEASEE
jgi:small subunit ribosomal protein S3